jgi:hypothetical protein
VHTIQLKVLASIIHIALSKLDFGITLSNSPPQYVRRLAWGSAGGCATSAMFCAFRRTCSFLPMGACR